MSDHGPGDRIVDGPAAEQFLVAVRRNAVTAALIDRLAGLDLPDCWLVAGCLFQTIWNARDGKAAAAGIRDYDVFYFDDSNLSYEAEDHVIRHVSAACADLPGTIEVKNQARVHLWYAERFKHDYPQLTSSSDGIGRFLVACTCVAVSCAPDHPAVVQARFGLDDLYAGRLRPNPCNRNDRLFAAKADSYRARWPWLHVVDG